jgi:hypothetical protein
MQIHCQTARAGRNQALRAQSDRERELWWERERERERKRAQSVREEVGVGARSQSERGGGMGSKAAGRQAGRQACEGKQTALDTDEQSARRGGNKRKWGKKRKQRAGHKRRGKKARDLRSWSSLLFNPLPACLPACPPFVNRCTT